MSNIIQVANSIKQNNLKMAKLTSKFLCHMGLIILAIIVLIPFFWMISCSLKTLPEVFRYPPEWIPSSVKWDNYRFVMTETFAFFRFFLNTLLVSVARTLGILVVSSMAAFAFARLRFQGRDAFFLLFLGTLIIPPQVAIIPTFMIMKYIKWIDTYYALIFPGMFTAFGTFLLRQFFLTLPKEIEDAAVIDGCGYFRIYWQITLPLSKPALAALGIFSFITAWSEFLWPLIVIKSDSMKTLTLGLTFFQGMYYTEWNYLMAAAAITIVLPVVLYIAAQRYFIQGITMTGIKR